MMMIGNDIADVKCAVGDMETAVVDNGGFEDVVCGMRTIETIHERVEEARKALAEAMLACAANKVDDFIRLAGDIYHHLNDIDNDVETLSLNAGPPSGRR
jgi:hypothetical protein